MSYQRTQYNFDLSGVKFKSRSDILKMARQWETFERIENYNSIIYQKFQTGDRSVPYYFFKDREEMNDYRNGRELHILRYSYLPPETFDSIANRPMPDAVVRFRAPEYSMGTSQRGMAIPVPISASEATSATADTVIYTHVSTFNSEHVFKYLFTSDEEKMAYHRAERRIRCGF